MNAKLKGQVEALVREFTGRVTRLVADAIVDEVAAAPQVRLRGHRPADQEGDRRPLRRARHLREGPAASAPPSRGVAPSARCTRARRRYAWRPVAHEVLSFHDVTKTYALPGGATHDALRGVSVDVRAPRAVALMGRSG